MAFITLTLVHLLLVLIFPEQITNMASMISHRPIGSTFLGLMILIIVPYLSILLILSIAGIPFALLLSAILLPISIYGKTAIFLSIGVRSSRNDRMLWRSLLGTGFIEWQRWFPT